MWPLKTRFHGRTPFTVSAGGQPTYFALLPPDRRAAYNDLNSASALIDDNTCAAIVEPAGEAA
ncbi:hypothetical protein KCP78_04870 [Salmonella enterica subsp. enterica]|nr:hypothetical protein KCP78_04870 [Salmonella enterica subsp. enterica]